MPAAVPSISHASIRLGVPRHLQDCNGYCGPACVMMVHSTEATSMEAQHLMFQRVRAHAKQAHDRRPVKSPAESLLALLNGSGGGWEKIFDAEPEPVAARIVQAVEEPGKPCLLLVSKGMHWVVAFGRTRRDDGTVAGVLLRDPAWAGMPSFFGLTTLPDKPTFKHTAGLSCHCLDSDNPPGSVHERYFALEELLSPRGLQGSSDWDGKGAIALVPVASRPAAALPMAPRSDPPGPPDPRVSALHEAREHGLYGRADSPPEWQAVLHGGTAGSPILVKDPDDPRDDYYLVPVHAANPAQRRTAWIILDLRTLRLREAALLDHWTVPGFPTEDDAQQIANHKVTLPDGTKHRFKISRLRPNERNLVWKPSAQSLLPYWPVKEFTAPHPTTRAAISIYMTQEGAVCTALTDDREQRGRRPLLPLLPLLLFGLMVLATGCSLIIGYDRLRFYQARAQQLEREVKKLNESTLQWKEFQKKLEELAADPKGDNRILDLLDVWHKLTKPKEQDATSVRIH